MTHPTRRLREIIERLRDDQEKEKER